MSIYQYHEDVQIEHYSSDELRQHLKPGAGYFVYLHCATWNNSSGWNVLSASENPLWRSYGSTVVPAYRTSGKKVLICREYHHDKPMGHFSVIISLTETEYNDAISQKRLRDDKNKYLKMARTYLKDIVGLVID